jgi:hypothetical protein
MLTLCEMSHGKGILYTALKESAERPQSLPGGQGKASQHREHLTYNLNGVQEFARGQGVFQREGISRRKSAQKIFHL